jgi:hypothetical protein
MNLYPESSVFRAYHALHGKHACGLAGETARYHCWCLFLDVRFPSRYFGDHGLWARGITARKPHQERVIRGQSRENFWGRGNGKRCPEPVHRDPCTSPSVYLGDSSLLLTCPQLVMAGRGEYYGGYKGYPLPLGKTAHRTLSNAHRAMALNVLPLVEACRPQATNMYLFAYQCAGGRRAVAGKAG